MDKNIKWYLKEKHTAVRFRIVFCFEEQTPESEGWTKEQGLDQKTSTRGSHFFALKHFSKIFQINVTSVDKCLLTVCTCPSTHPSVLICQCACPSTIHLAIIMAVFFFLSTSFHQPVADEQMYFKNPFVFYFGDVACQVLLFILAFLFSLYLVLTTTPTVASVCFK